MKCLGRMVLLLGAFVVLFGGCSMSSSAFLRYEERKVESVKTAKEATRLMLAEWPFRSGLLTASFSGIKDQLPLHTNRAMAELDGLAMKFNREGLTDYELGLAIGYRLLMLSTTTKEVVKRYAPSVFKYIPIAP